LYLNFVLKYLYVYRVERISWV